jgi:acetoin utilization protein AcuC
MTCAAAIVYDDFLTSYDFGPGHPLAPVRIELTAQLAEALGILARPSVTVVSPEPATDADLLRVHTADYVAAVKAASVEGADRNLARGLGTSDNPIFPGMHEATARVVGATLAAARRVWDGDADHGVNISGGLHHAMADYASGFCIYNDPAIAITALLEWGAGKVAYVDTDVHHGDGVQAAFYDEPRVLTISLHESPATLFPGTGTAAEVGGTSAKGSAVNVPLPPGTDDRGWLRAFFALVPPLLREFQPDVVVTQHGCDTHEADPLAHLMLSVDGQRAAQLALHDLAHEICGGRWIATGGGGYAVVDVVPRTWSHLLAVAAGTPLDPNTPTPREWQELAAGVSGRPAPPRMTDGRSPTYAQWPGGYDADSWLDRSIAETAAAVFPYFGLSLDR